MIQKTKTLIWFLKRPRFYPHLAHLVSRKLSPASARRDNTRQEALQWCAGLAVNTETALVQLTGKTAPTPVESLHSDYFDDAEKMARDCPVKMGGPGNLDLLYWSAEHLGASRVIETGVAYGWSSLAILLSLRNRPDSELISTDMPYPHRNGDRYVGCVVPKELATGWRIIQYPDRQALPRAVRALGTIDMCHYDSDKSYDGRMWAYRVLWKALRRGGLFLSDDIGDNIAFRDFSRMIECDPTVVEKDGKFVGVMVKP